eukprot:11476434-Ditylum_brightwellii.AAC.1
MESKFNAVDNFLVLEEPMSDCYQQCQTIDIGSGKDTGKHMSKRRSKCVLVFHLIEPSCHHLYVASDLNVPHYQNTVDRHRETGKKDTGRDNMFFDRDHCSS